ncbi:TPA: Abi family protein [Pseudomonas aeruginosa]|nr:Abi family protein [Pseudomonas aeruginosa]HCE8130061.1 Abi family protein [Pseudomonas aeruginosa]HCF0448353.1 Abi family protein [Pseudomonas aeruginosa]
MPRNHIVYSKPAKSPIGLAKHLSAKGLNLRGQQADAIRAVQFVGYYRLLMYTRALQDPATKRFYPGTSFDDVMQLYNFDRQLRFVLMDAIERIEVAMRAAIVCEIAGAPSMGPHFYTDATHFSCAEEHLNFMRTTVSNQLRGRHIEHYFSTYTTPSLPPIWAILESVSFGAISKTFSGLHLDHRKKVASLFSYDEKIITSWLKTINSLRNDCAHHKRVWNNNVLANSPQYAKSIAAEFPANSLRGSLGARATVLAALIQEIEPNTTWKTKFKTIMAGLPTATMAKAGITEASLGFHANWQSRPFWA